MRIIQFTVADGAFRASRSQYSRAAAALSASQRLDYGAHFPNCPDELLGLGEAPLVYDRPSTATTETHGAAPDISAGQLVSGEWIVTVPVVPKTASDIQADLYARKAAKRRTVDERLAILRDAGYAHADGNIYQIDETGRQNMGDVLTMLNAGVANAHGGYWRDAANATVSKSEAEVRALFVAAFDYGAGLIRAAHSHKAAIDSLNTSAEVDAYDIGSGWP